MENLAYTPVHKETGLALSVLVKPEDFVSHKNRQHHKEHPESRPELNDLAGKALRRSTTLQLPDHLHMGSISGSYHDIFWGPEKVPQDTNSKMNKVYLYLAGVVPREAIKLTGDGYDIVNLTDEEHEFISHPRVTHIEGRTERKRQHVKDSIGHAIILHALEQPVTDMVSSKVRSEFLETLDWRRERELANLILRDSIDEAIRPALRTYEEAKAERMVSAQRLGLRAVVRSFVPDRYLSNYYELIRRSLQSEEAQLTPALQTGVNKLN
jgi:hypothetical protein